MKNILILFSVLAAAPVFADEDPLSSADIAKTVTPKLADVKACMKQHGEATGRVVVHFVVQPDGKVNDVKAKENSSNAALDKCVLNVFAHLTFPKPKGGQTMPIAYPIAFKPAPKPKEGHLADAQIVDTVKVHLKEVQGCYTEALKDNPKLAGTVTMGIVVSPEGKVVEAKPQKSDTGLPSFDNCVAQKVTTWTFPKPEGGGEAAFLYPFQFAAKK
jgi:TonB family protein